MTRVSIIIVHYKNVKETENTISSLKSMETEGLSVDIILVNNSKEDISKITSSPGLPLKLLNSPENVGFAQGCNLGINEAKKSNSEYCLFLNSDTIVSSNLLQMLIKKMDANTGIVSPKIYFAKGHEFHKTRYKEKEFGRVIWYAGGAIDWNNIYASHIGVDQIDEGQFDKEKDVDFATGCCMLVKKEVFNVIGLFDPNYFVYYEDVDLSVRSKEKGFGVRFVPQTHIWHKNALSSDAPGSDIHVYFQTRNRYYFALKYASLKTKAHILKEMAKNILGKDKNKKSASIDAVIGNMKKGSFKNV